MQEIVCACTELWNRHGGLLIRLCQLLHLLQASDFRRDLGELQDELVDHHSFHIAAQQACACICLSLGCVLREESLPLRRLEEACMSQVVSARVNAPHAINTAGSIPRVWGGVLPHFPIIGLGCTAPQVTTLICSVV